MDDTDIAPVFLPDADLLHDLHDDFNDDLISNAFEEEWDYIRTLDESVVSSGNLEHVDVVTPESNAQSATQSLGLHGRRSSIKRSGAAAGLMNDLDIDDTNNCGPKTTNFDFHLQDACLRINRSNDIKMPWETGFGASLFKGKSVGPNFTLPTIGRFEPYANYAFCDQPKDVSSSWTTTKPFQARRLLAARFAKSEDHLRAAALKKVRSIVLLNPSDSQLGRSLLGCAGALVGEDEIVKSFIDCFEAKSTGTLTKRANDFHRFALWQVETNGSFPLSPTEAHLYMYLNFLRDSGAAPTAGTSFLKAWAFMRYTVGAGFGQKESLLSGRVQGAARSMYLKKRKLKQAPPLPADTVWALEDMMHCESVRDDEKVTLGFILFCIYSSSRFSDAARSMGLDLDKSQRMYLLETATGLYKTAITQEKRTTLLPLIALGAALHNQPWCTSWLLARRRQGVSNHSLLMPALSELTGRWLDRHMTTAEGCYWLRDFLCMSGMTEAKAGLFSCHSLKATALSWVTKAGVMSSLEKKIMGHHWDSENAMPLTCSRDALCEVMVKLYRVISCIKSGQFDPDASRAERVAAATAGQVVLPADTPELELHSEPEDADEHESDVDEIDFQQALEEVACPAAGDHFRPAFPDVSLDSCVQHKVSGIVHLIRDDDSLVCGRRLSANFVEPVFVKGKAHEQNFCEHCHKHLANSKSAV